MLNQLNNITIEALKKYLLQDLWKKDFNFPNKKIELFKKIIDDEEFCLIIPSRDDYKDAQIRIENTVEMLSELKEVATQKIVSEILRYSDRQLLVLNKEIETAKNNDIISFRIVSQLSKEGKIPLEYGSNIVEGLKKLILSAIFNEECPQPYFFKTNKESHEKLSRYKLGQSAFGSYIFNIEIENDIEEQLYINDKGVIESISEERRVIRRIQNGIRDVKENNLDTLSENGYQKGLNANMCDALLNLNLENYDIKIESKVTWSEVLPKPENIIEKVILESNDFYKVKTLLEKYKETKTIEYKLKGRIVRLNNKNDSRGNTIERYIVVQTEVEGKSKNVKVPLRATDYKNACEAHKQDQEVVLNGQLLKEGKTWVINDYRNFKIL
jgi:hypothetical protein